MPILYTATERHYVDVDQLQYLSIATPLIGCHLTRFPMQKYFKNELDHPQGAQG